MIAAIIQARMGSTRLPGKTLAEIAGKPMLGHVLERAGKIGRIDRVIMATTDNPADEPIRRFASENNTLLYVGSEDDVLDRFYQAAKQYDVSVIVRVTSDCPLLDPDISALVLKRFLYAQGDLDYVSNIHPPTFPDGLDTEVFSFTALERAWSHAKAISEREHVTPYIWKHPDKFRIGNVTHESDLSELRWTVDEAPDLEFVRAVYAHLGKKGSTLFSLSDVLALLERKPDLVQINRGISRNEGYAKSLAKEDVSPKETPWL